MRMHMARARRSLLRSGAQTTQASGAVAPTYHMHALLGLLHACTPLGFRHRACHRSMCIMHSHDDTYCSTKMLKFSLPICSVFYERLKEVRDYHRRYPYLEVTEVRRSNVVTCSVIPARDAVRHALPCSAPAINSERWIGFPCWCCDPGQHGCTLIAAYRP